MTQQHKIYPNIFVNNKKKLKKNKNLFIFYLDLFEDLSRFGL